MSDRWRVHFKRHCACWDSVPPYLVEMCYITPPPTVSQTGRVFKNNKAKIREEIVSQNLLGLKSEARLEEFFFSFKSRGLLAACVQEGLDWNRYSGEWRLPVIPFRTERNEK